MFLIPALSRYFFGSEGHDRVAKRGTVGRVADVLADGYTLHDGPPPRSDAVDIRKRAGLSPRTNEQTAVALAGSWAAAHVVHDGSGDVVGMGRVIGDGGWYFHIVDMAVLPRHQRRGIGAAVLVNLLDRIEATAPAGAYITLLADGPGRPLYRRHGFVETAPASVGMVLRPMEVNRQPT